MQFILGLLVGLMLGAVTATAYVSHAQLAPFTAPLEEQLDAQRTESYLKLEQQLNDLRHDRLDPCRR